MKMSVSLEAQYEKYKTKLVPFAYNIVGDSLAAEDVVQEILNTYFLNDSAHIQEPDKYLMRSVINRARSRARRRGRETAALSWVAPNPSVEDTYSSPDLLRLVAELPVQQRAAVYLVYWEDLAPVEAARVMGVRPGTLRRYLHDARHRLEGVLDDR